MTDLSNIRRSPQSADLRALASVFGGMLGGQYQDIPLPVADTKPPMFFGVVPYWLVGFIALGIAFTITLVSNFWVGLVVVFAFWFPLAGFGWAVVRKDYNRPRILWAWLRTKAFSLDTDRWGGTSPTPLPVRPSTHYPRGMDYATR